MKKAAILRDQQVKNYFFQDHEFLEFVLEEGEQDIKTTELLLKPLTEQNSVQITGSVSHEGCGCHSHYGMEGGHGHDHLHLTHQYIDENGTGGAVDAGDAMQILSGETSYYSLCHIK